MNYQTSWQEKARRLPADIFSRLEKTTNTLSPKRALLTGLGIELALSDLIKFLNAPEWKIFISQADGGSNHIYDNSTVALPTSTNNIVYLKGDPVKHITSLPSSIFDLIISLWDLPFQNPDMDAYIKNIYRLLKKTGKLCIISYIDGSPELPLDIVKQIIRQAKLPMKLFRSTLPNSAGNFRKMLNKNGFKDARIWRDSIPCIYQSAELLHKDIFLDSDKNLFAANTTREQRDFIKREFVKEAGRFSFPLEISYDFVGGVGGKS